MFERVEAFTGINNLEKIKTLIKDDLDSNLAAVQRIAGNQARIANKRKGIDTVAIMRQLQEVLKAIRKQIGITNTAHPKAFKTLKGITSLNQWLKNRTVTITNSGLVNEDSNAVYYPIKINTPFTQNVNIDCQIPEDAVGRGKEFRRCFRRLPGEASGYFRSGGTR